MQLIDVGFGNTVNASRIIALLSAEAAPSKRYVSTAKDKFMAVDATCGKKTKTVIIMDSGHVISSSKDLDILSKLCGEVKSVGKTVEEGEKV